MEKIIRGEQIMIQAHLFPLHCMLFFRFLATNPSPWLRESFARLASRLANPARGISSSFLVICLLWIMHSRVLKILPPNNRECCFLIEIPYRFIPKSMDLRAILKLMAERVTSRKHIMLQVHLLPYHSLFSANLPAIKEMALSRGVIVYLVFALFIK